MKTESEHDEEADEARLLRDMAVEATEFISAFDWAPAVEEKILCFGIGGVISVFLFRFSEYIGGTDNELWVVVGDLPSAYLVVEQDRNPHSAVENYCQLMEDWCLAVETTGDLTDVYPVQASPTSRNANLLRKRIEFIRDSILQYIPSSIPAN